MLNYQLKNLPERTVKPRSAGFTMAMDKGLSVREAEDFIEVAGHLTDVVKIGWTTGLFTPSLKKKLDVFRAAGIPFYFGGTMLEAFYIRGQFEDYCRMIDEYKLPFVEVSNGSIDMTGEEKFKIISRLSKNFIVLSEVGSKDSNKDIPPYKWVEWMNNELAAGAWKVIAEARESGTVGIFRSSGKAHVVLVNRIIAKIPKEKIIWEAPMKSQQGYFVKLIGANVNLGNIAPNEVIPLETLRLGLRSDTFFTFLKK